MQPHYLEPSFPHTFSAHTLLHHPLNVSLRLQSLSLTSRIQAVSDDYPYNTYSIRSIQDIAKSKFNEGKCLM